MHQPSLAGSEAEVNVHDGKAMSAALIRDKAVVAVLIKNVHMDSNENILNTDCEVYLPAGPFNAVCSIGLMASIIPRAHYTRFSGDGSHSEATSRW